MNGLLRKIAMAAVMAAVAHAGPPHDPKGASAVLTADANGAFHLSAADAVLSRGPIRLEQHGDQSQIADWRDPSDTATWKVRVPSDGRYLVRIETAAETEGSVLLVKCNGKLALSVPATGNLDTYKTSRVGEVLLAAGKEVTLTLKPVVDGWRPIHVRKVELVPLP